MKKNRDFQPLQYHYGWTLFSAHLRQRLKVSYCDRSLSVLRRPSVHKLFLQTTSPPEWMFPMMPPFKIAYIIPLHWTEGSPELQMRNLLKDISWTIDPNSKKSQNCSSWYPLPKLHKWLRSAEQMLPELQIRNTFKWNFLLNNWSKFEITTQDRFSWCLLPILHKWIQSTEQRGCQSSR